MSEYEEAIDPAEFTANICAIINEFTTSKNGNVVAALQNRVTSMVQFYNGNRIMFNADQQAEIEESIKKLDIFINELKEALK